MQLPRPEPADSGETFGCLRVDAEAHQAWVHGVELALTVHEFRLLLTLYRRRGRVQSRDQLIDAAWEDGTHVGERTIDTHVKRLRKKLGAAAAYVSTIRGVGYRFAIRSEP